MKGDKDKLIVLFERKIELLLENNKGYARFKEINPLTIIKRMLSKEPSKTDIIDLGFLLHLYVLQFRLTVYKNLTPFSALNCKKDLQEINNALHAYSRYRNPHLKLPFQLTEAKEINKLIPPFTKISGSIRFPLNNLELYTVILDMLEEDVGKVDVEIPSDIIREMQNIDLKNIYNELPKVIERMKCCTVKTLVDDFPVYKNEKLSLVSVFNEVLFLANEGKVLLKQLVDDVSIYPLMK